MKSKTFDFIIARLDFVMETAEHRTEIALESSSKCRQHNEHMLNVFADYQPELRLPNGTMRSNDWTLMVLLDLCGDCTWSPSEACIRVYYPGPNPV